MDSRPQHLPPGLEVEGLLGSGRRSVVWTARYRGEPAVLKCYREAFVRKYRERYGLDIARFEFSRNEAFRAVPGLARFAARPLALTGQDGVGPPGFVQERIDGVPLVELARREGGLPRSVLEAGDLIVARAEAAGLHDLDLYYENILLRRCDGEWLPALHDFNLVPQHRYPPNPFLAFAYRSGLRRKSHRDYRCIRQWRTVSAACAAR